MAGTVLGNDTDAEGDKLSVITIRPFEPHPVAFSPVSADAAGTAHGTMVMAMHSDGSQRHAGLTVDASLTETSRAVVTRFWRSVRQRDHAEGDRSA